MPGLPPHGFRFQLFTTKCGYLRGLADHTPLEVPSVATSFSCILLMGNILWDVC